jgi:hypothetical protein
LRAENSRSPVSAFHITTPSENKSARWSKFVPAACSGDRARCTSALDAMVTHDADKHELEQLVEHMKHRVSQLEDDESGP